jgi:NADPH:quinone reductase-like Zn-dependent oxidoreductase
MATMQALVASAVGEPADVLRLEPRPVPEPGPGQVRVRVHATPVHATDLHIIRGRYGFAPPFPAVLGVECVGTVDALGDGVEAVAAGQRVVTVGVTGTWQVAGGAIGIPEGQPFPIQRFADGVRLAEAPGHGGKPLLLLDD